VSSRTIRQGTVTVIVLTYNEEKNLPHALASVAGWSHETFVLDSLSTDGTLDIARKFGCASAQNRFEDYAKQRNYALEHLPITSEWVLFLDADEWLPDATRNEISAIIARSPVENGFYINRRLIWMGRWIRRGYYPSWILRLFRLGKGRCEDRSVNEQIIVEGATGQLRCDFVHQDRKGVTDWIAKHNGYATREAMELLKGRSAPGYQEIDARLLGSQGERRRWLRHVIWNRLPALLRPFGYFFYRYVLQRGFLDGVAAFMFHFLQALWYPMLIDIKYLELKANHRQPLPEAAPAEPADVAGLSKLGREELVK
jgi:glycosyltransferase involved in cell wall biosynthesis